MDMLSFRKYFLLVKSAPEAFFPAALYLFLPFFEFEKPPGEMGGLSIIQALFFMTLFLFYGGGTGQDFRQRRCLREHR